MTEEVKILKSGLVDIKKELEFLDKYGCGEDGDKTAFNIIKIICDALKQADKINDTHPSGHGPSEEDRKRMLKLREIIYDSFIPNQIDIKWLYDMAAKAMGRE